MSEKIKGRAVSVWLNEAEEKKLHAKAAKLNMKPSAVLKFAAFDYSPKIRTKKTSPALLSALARIGNNVNQIARAANKSGEVDPLGLLKIKELLENLHDK